MNKIHNPSTIAAPGGYSHGIELRPGVRLLYVAGQVGVRPDGTLAEQFDEQAEWTFKNILAVLESAGMGREDIVRFGIYLTRTEDLAAYGEAQRKYIGEAHRPTDTLLFVAGLARPEAYIEVDAVAAKP